MIVTIDTFYMYNIHYEHARCLGMVYLIKGSIAQELLVQLQLLKCDELKGA
jgi:hypothetical protein